MGAPYVLSKPPGVALIGGGFIGPVHAEALRRLGIPVVGVLDLDLARATAVAEQLGGVTPYGSLDDLLADPKVQSVHIASPNPAHFEQAKRCLSAGKHVLCEKPLAVTSRETAELAKLAASRPELAAGVNYNIRFYPIAREMKARVASGDIGKVLSVQGSYTQDWLLLPTDYNWRVEPDGATNLRAVADIGTHWMDLVQSITGSHISGVLAELATFHPTRQRPVGPTDTFGGSAGKGSSVEVPIATEDYGAILLRFDNGARGTYYVSQAFAGRKNRLALEVCGTEGSLTWDSQRPDELVIGRRGRLNEFLQRDPGNLSAEAAAMSHYPGGHAEGFPDAFKQLFAAFYGWIASDRKAKPTFPTFADGDYEVRICEAIAASAKKSAWTEVAKG
jgi:predicted dehydrogenase